MEKSSWFLEYTGGAKTAPFGCGFHLMKQKPEYDLRDKHNTAPNFGTLYLVVCIVLVGLIFFNSRIFEIKTVLVEGNQTLSAEDILRNSNLNPHLSIFQLNTRQIQRNILRNPKIESALVTYRFPNQLTIRVRERHPLCLLLFLENLLIVGEDAVVIGIKDENEPIKLPEVTGISLSQIKIGSVIADPQFKVALEILRLADENLRVILGEIDVKNYFLYIDPPNSKHTLKVELGNADQLEEKIAKNLRSILSHTAPEELAKIDLRVVSFPTAIKNPNHK